MQLKIAANKIAQQMLANDGRQIMKALASPYQTGQLTKKWYHFFGPPWHAYFSALKRQVEDRGQVPRSEWPNDRQAEIAERIEVILAEQCWGERLSFHPSDPYLIIGEFECGDLSEVEGVMAIEEEFGVDLPEGLIEGTLGSLVKYIETETANKRLVPEARTSPCTD